MMCELFNPILDAQNEVTWIWLKKNVHCNVFLDIFSQEIPLLILSYFRVAADFVKKVLGFVYKGSDAQLCITTFVICFEGLWVTTWYYFFSLCELILNLTKNLEEIHLRIMTVTSKKLVYCLGLEPPDFVSETRSAAPLSIWPSWLVDQYWISKVMYSLLWLATHYFTVVSHNPILPIILNIAAQTASNLKVTTPKNQYFAKKSLCQEKLAQFAFPHELFENHGSHLKELKIKKMQ